MYNMSKNYDNYNKKDSLINIQNISKNCLFTSRVNL